MHLDPTAGKIFIDGYSQILAMVHALARLERTGSPNDRLAAARQRLARESEMLDEALDALERRRGILVDEAVVAAIRTLELGRWIYLRDLRHHSIFLHPDGVIGFGVVGLTQRIRDITGGPGCLVEAGVLVYAGQFICDGLITERVALGSGYREEFDRTYKELKAIGAFHVVPLPGFTNPPKECGPRARRTSAGRTRVSEAVRKVSSNTGNRKAPAGVSAQPGHAAKEVGGLACTPLQGQYLAFIQAYTTINGRPPAERDLQVFFQVTPPVVHQMIQGLAAKELLQREPGKARSLRVLVPPEGLPVLVRPSRGK